MKYLGSDADIKSNLSNVLDKGSSAISLVDATLTRPLNPNEIVVGKSLDNRAVVELVVDRGARHVVQMPNIDFVRQVVFSAQVLSNPEAFFKAPRQMLVANGDKGLITDPIKIADFNISNYASKDAILDLIRKEISEIPRMNTVRDPALIVSDEMLMNVIKDAPKYFLEQNPGADITKRQAKISLAHDGTRLLIWTEDDFGSLNTDKMLRRLHQCYSSDQVDPITKEGEGAGLGCRIIFDLSVSMSVFVKPGIKTVFCAVLPIGLSYRQQQTLPKNIQIIALSF